MDNGDSRESLSSMSLGDHLDELRGRLMLAIAGLLVGLTICLFFGKYLFQVIVKPYISAMEDANLDPRFLVIQPSDQFMVYVKTSLVFGVIISAPWIFYHAWAFISSGLYKRERKFIHTVAPISAILFITGSLFFILIVAPMAMLFFVNFKIGIDFVQSGMWSLQSYINFILSLTLIFGLAFQMPIAIVFAEKMGLVSVKALTASRKFVILGLVIIAAIATPPDVISQIALAIPLYVLYESSILVCRLLRKRKQ
jgi:sec-independent protein translocase protein TatC